MHTRFHTSTDLLPWSPMSDMRMKWWSAPPRRRQPVGQMAEGLVRSEVLARMSGSRFARRTYVRTAGTSSPNPNPAVLSSRSRVAASPSFVTSRPALLDDRKAPRA